MAARIPGKVSFAVGNLNTLLRAELERIAAQILDRSKPIIKEKVGELVTAALRASPEYNIILSDSNIQGFLGSTQYASVLEQVINLLVNNISVNRRKTALEITLFAGNYASLSQVPFAQFVSESGIVIPWLEWVLLSGTSVVNTTHAFVFGDFENSRTGFGLMFPSSLVTTNSLSSVPAQIAGTAADNWITRALNPLGPDIEQIVIQVVTQVGSGLS